MPRRSYQVVRPAMATLAALALPVLGVGVLALFIRDLAAWLSAMPIGLAIAWVVIGGGLLVGMALVPTHAMSLTAGWLFGVSGGGVVAWCAVALGAWIGYGVGGRLAGKALMMDLPGAGGARWQQVRVALVAASWWRGVILVTLLRLSPAAPFAATNVAMVALGVPRGVFWIGTMVGLAPRIAVVVLFGAAMAELDISQPRSPVLLALGFVTTVAAIVIIGLTARRAMDHALRTMPPPTPAPSSPRSRPQSRAVSDRL